jgi:hypothetical protein
VQVAQPAEPQLGTAARDGILLDALSKEFRIGRQRVVALAGVDLAVPRGAVARQEAERKSPFHQARNSKQASP